MGINFVSQIVLAYFFGATEERDSYFLAITAPTYFTTLFTGSVTVMFLPFLIELKKRRSEEELENFISSVLLLCFASLTLIALLGFLFSEKIVHLIAPGFNQTQLNATVELFNILIFTLVFQSLASFIAVFHHVESKFLLPAISPIMIPITALIVVLLFHSVGIKSLAIGTLTGSVISAILLLPFVFRYSKKIRISTSKKANADVITLFSNALPLFFSGAIYRSTTIVERVIASNLPPGGVSYLGYGNQIYLLLATIASGSIVTTFYPLMSDAWISENKVDFNNAFNRGITLILIITLPIAAILIAMREQVIAILFERGAFDHVATHAVANTMALLMGAFIFGSLGNIVVKVFYIANRTITISLIAIAEVGIYIVVGYILSLKYTYLGLAFTLTLSTGFTIVASLAFLLQWKFVRITGLFVDTVKLLLSAMFCGLVAHTFYQATNVLPEWIATFLSGVLAIMVYIILIFFVLKISDASVIIKTVKGMLQSKEV